MINLFKIKLDSKRIFGLDLLRALAIFFVVLEHGEYLLPEEFKPINRLFVFDGVSFFFVLSGFLIGQILIRSIIKNGVSIKELKRFWIRRWFRTLPSYFLILAIVIILSSLFNDDFTVLSVKRYFIFSQNIFSSHPRFFAEAWSLSVEEWFYILTPIVLLVLGVITKTYRTSILLTVLITIIAVTYFRYYRYSTLTIDSMDDWDLLFRKQVFTRLDSLMFGFLGAYLSSFHKNTWFNYKNHLLWSGLVLLIIGQYIGTKHASADGLYQCVFSFTLTSIATLFLLPFLSELKSSGSFLYKPITYLSLISYSMYLINFTIVQDWIIKHIPWHNFSNNLLLIDACKYTSYWILVLLLSILIYKYFEVPMTSLRERFK